ncbi:hypothetical protein C8F01DRAFT_1084466 [Mycena amicta]|nr:hypothetical protein C8F01DRAFT_1084466 [Mycena amicta]
MAKNPHRRTSHEREFFQTHLPLVLAPSLFAFACSCGSRVLQRALPSPLPTTRHLVLFGVVLLRHIVGHEFDCATGLAPALSHFTTFLRLECSDSLRKRFAGIADVAAQRVLAIHEKAAEREEHRRRRSGNPYPPSDRREAPFASGTFPASLLPGSPLVAAMLDEVLTHVCGYSKLMPYAMRVAAQDLYLGPVRQRPDVTDIYDRIPDKYFCGICLAPKSHPVIFACPTCRSIQYEAPRVAVEEEAAINSQILPYIDWTIVLHSWEGLRFPHEPLSGVATSDEHSESDSDGTGDESV